MEGLLLNAVAAELFYHSIFFMVPGMVITVFYCREKKRAVVRKKIHAMRTELKEFLGAVTAALQTGRSVENAFMQAVKDSEQYLGKATLLLPELKKICSAAVTANEPLEKLFAEFSCRIPIEELEYFAEVFAIGKRSGGNLVALMNHTVRMLRERMEAEEEIYTVMTQKRLEFYLMAVVPLAILGYLRMGAPSLIGQMYHNFFGIAIMTVCAAIYGGCYLYGERLLEIEM